MPMLADLGERKIVPQAGAQPQTRVAEGDPGEELRSAAQGASLLVVPRRAEVPRTPETTAHIATH